MLPSNFHASYLALSINLSLDGARPKLNKKKSVPVHSPVVDCLNKA